VKNIKIRIYKTVLLPVVLYGCETWSLTLREEHLITLFRTFELNRDEVTGGWRKLHNEEVHNLYSFPSISRISEGGEMSRVCSTNGGRRGMHIEY
jgi:hypothetical protein